MADVEQSVRRLRRNLTDDQLRELAAARRRACDEAMIPIRLAARARGRCETRELVCTSGRTPPGAAI